jgi:superfamily I DNA and/or RNA helicase
LIPFYVSKKVVLAGDHKQLPPFASDELREREMHISLFEHLVDVYGDDLTTLLRRQYRMNSAIAEFSNREFYNNKLSHGGVNKDWTLQDFAPIQAYHVEGEEQRTRSKSLRNESEIDVIIEELDRLFEKKISPGDIGIITPYGGQVGAIRHRLNEYEQSTNQIKVDTVDSFQGGEREVILVSFVRSNDAGRTGFLTFPDVGSRRLNVALTRARKRLVLIANWDTLTTAGPNEQIQQTRVYQRLHEYLKNVGAVVESANIIE